MRDMPAVAGATADTTQTNRMVVCLSIVAGATIIVCMSLGKAILAPIALALVLGVVVSPLVEWLVRRGVPRTVTAVVIVSIILCSIIGLLTLIEPAFAMAAELLPQILAAVRSYLASFSTVFSGLDSIGQQLGSDAALSEEDLADQVPSLGDAIWLAPNFGAQFFIFVGTLFFFVLTRNDIYEKAPQSTQVIREADRAVSKYFAAVSTVNCGLGVVTTLVMTVIGVEYPIVWGVAAALLNFILYLGPICMMAALLVAGLLQFGGAYALVPPLAFFMLNATEAQFVTPLVVGQHVHINPLFVFLAIVGGLWLWGPVGAIVAIPILIWTLRVFRAPPQTEVPSPLITQV